MMDTRLATTNIRIQQWTAIFKAKAESGLTVDEYCEQNDISRNAYYYWLRRARNATSSVMMCPGESNCSETYESKRRR